jgi:hypothetical protein
MRFPIHSDLQQRHSLSSLHFNFSLECAFKRFQESSEVLEMSLVCVDGVPLLERA